MPVFRGGEGPPPVGGPTRSRGTRSSSWVFQLPGHSMGWEWRGRTRRQPTASLKRNKGLQAEGQDLASARCPVMQALQSVSVQGIRDQEAQEKRRHRVGQRAGVQRPCPSSNLKALITAFGESPGGGRGPLLSAWGRAGSFLPSMNQRETEAQGLLAREGPQPSGHLDFLGFSADLVIVVNADGDKKEAAGQEQQNPQGHEAGLG